MTLALLIMAVGGAWAQSSLNVVKIEVPKAWETDGSNLTTADLTGFKTSTLDEAKAWTGAPEEGMAILFYAFDGDVAYYVPFSNGRAGDGAQDKNPKNQIFGVKSVVKFYYTYAEPTEWELKPDETGKNWILAEMPSSNIELQVEYYPESNLFLSKEALADKGSIAVKAGDLGVQFGEDGKSANTVTEGSAMTVKYNGTKKILGMKVEKKEESLIVNPVVGQIIGSDGKNYAYGSLPDGVKAVAKICYVSGSNGLALALTDEEGEMNWSTAQTTCTAHTPAITGGTWKLPSKDEWDNMISAAGSFTDLRDGFSSVGGTNLQSGGYWSSTEKASDLAWYYYFYYGGWGSDNKDRGFYVRPCLAF